MRRMTSLLQRAVSRLLASSPNYVEITALLATALAARVLFLPAFWKVSPQACVAFALFVSILVYACVDRGQLFAYFGWVHPRRGIFWLYALIAGAAAAARVITILRAKHTPLGHTSPATLLYGVTIGPIIEEILFRGAAFSVIYVTAASIKRLLRLRLAIAIVLSCPLFAVAHTRTMGIPWLVFFGMGTSYAFLRWRSNSNRRCSSYARYIQRGDRDGNASRLVRFDRVSNLFYTFLIYFQQPRQRGR
jgi:membrane protease YdiL (CAAX protease family)